MADRHDYVALEWVKGEIAETLKQARLALDTFVASPDDSAAMDACLDAIHQVHGSLQMIEFYGAALLAEEIEQLALALKEDRVSRHAEAVQLLTLALSQLPVYLDRIHSARRDLPLVVLPLLNDLRSARGESLLSETSLFAPQLLTVPALDAETLSRRDTPELPTLLRKLRQTLQTALVGLLREQDLQTQLGYMTKVFARLELLCKDAPLGPLWRIASALVETMASGNFANSPALRSLFKDADKELKRLLDQGITAINQPAPDELLKSLLFYIAKSDSQAQKMLDLKDQYGLDDALPHSALVDEERARMAGPDRDAMRSVIVALCDELVRTKERLDVFVRGDRQHVSELSALLPPLRQIADTLAVLGFGQPRKVIIDQLAVVQGLAQGQREASDPALMDVAGALLYVEATLAGMAGTVDQSSREESRLPTTDLSQIHQLVIKEARVVLQQAKDVIVDYIDGEWDRERLEPLSALLVQVRGALAMIPLARASGLLSSCNDYILEHLLVEEGRPAQSQLDSLAEALTGVEYYLERMAEDPEAPGEHVLDLAQASLAKLGYSPVPDAVDLPVLEEVISDQEMVDLRARQALISPTQTIAEVLASPVSAVNPPARYIPASLLPPPKGEPAVDDELRDVFLEETDEMLAALRHYLPRWFADTDDFPALTEIRRAFHTLKGSGRMVRALILGELAWSVENLLNRVLEDNVEPGHDVRQLLADVQALLPDVIRDFAEDVQRQRDDVDVLAARAHALSRGVDIAGTQPAADQSLAVKTESGDEAEEGFDPQLLGIFRQEAQTHLETLNRFIDAPHDVDSRVFSDELLRALHTLKGSAYMAGVLPIAELASPFDQLVREFKTNQIVVAESEVELLRASEPLFRAGLAQLDDDPLRPIPGATQLIESARDLLDERMSAAMSAADDGLRPRPNPKLIETFLAEGMDILLDAESLLGRWREHPGERQELSALLDELTMLGHGAHMADLPQVDELCEALLDLYGAVEESSLGVSERFFHEAENAHEALINMLDQVAAGQQVEPCPERIGALRELLDGALDPGSMGVIKREEDGTLSLTDLPAVQTESPELAPDNTRDALDQEIVEIFLEEAVDILDSAGQALQRWLDDPENATPLSSLQRDLHTLKGGARMAEIEPVGDLGHELESLYEGLIDRRCSYSPPLGDLLVRSHDHLALMLEQLQHHKPLTSPQPVIEAIRDFRQNNCYGQPSEPDTQPPRNVGSMIQTLDERDPELMEIFLEEGYDIIESSGAALVRWQADPQNTLEVENLLRDLHTLKGGARMVEIAPIGDLAHELESLYESLASGGLKGNSALLNGLLQSGHDMLADMLDAVRGYEPLPNPALLIDSIRHYSASGGVREAVNKPVDAPSAAPSAIDPVAQPLTPDADAERTGPEMVKVPAEQLEDLVNLAGETSIFRGRIEQQVSDAQGTLIEMETTIERMRDQLRRLDIETQGRSHSRDQIQAERLGYEEFDPLEMDRHSQLQQLSRALFESASDLMDLKQTLDTRAHDAENLLQQQARVNTELQESLMRTRMVPFERMVPRLRRIVRQVSGELNKKVIFDVVNAEGEMDRNVLERMVAPLEHMLRNAIDHGLESTEKRLESGKPEAGHITLSLAHEGGDIVIEMSDDGAGVDFEAVRRKAIKRGMIGPNAVLSDHDTLQFILQAGFSTAETITQISGRGVGMDVVHAEVKELGGSMVIDSRSGQGARFRIRLPFSVSVNRALMVQCGEEQYAVPLNSIEGIVRVMPVELEAYYQASPPRYQYGERTYELRYLGELLSNAHPPKLVGQTQPLPVLLVHVHDQWLAVQVDALAGSREIVVKNLGVQFSGVQGISGATILGDGRVVLILDLFAHIRRFHARQLALQASGETPARYIEAEQVRPLLVMVVDDSITVRKVTGRLLERNGMNVLIAKDGVDAMALLQEHTPDIMLLDIEMPRMDGFEVASKIRADEGLKHLPIIMITSRSGQKHRDRAFAVGVNDYMSKPYQEAALLESIAHWSHVHV